MLPAWPKQASYATSLGVMLQGLAESVLKDEDLASLRGQVQLIFTSPPFPLNRKKRYGNLQGEDYITWLVSFGQLFRNLLAKDGSIVIELGNSWDPGLPTMSTLALRALLKFQDDNKLHLCQEFIYHNPARLPSPAQWVTVDRIRLKDSYTRLWWLSPTDRPKANNRNVLKAYSPAMERLLVRKSFNSGPRPSQHHISKKAFTKDNGGAIPANILSFSNTRNYDPYQAYCRGNGIQFHPSRMPDELPEFFIKFLTDKGDIVLDPFGGSNTTGAAAERLERKWIAIEPTSEYILGSLGRFNEATVVFPGDRDSPRVDHTT